MTLKFYNLACDKKTKYVIFFPFLPVATMSKKGAAPQKPTMKISTELKNLRTEENETSLEEVVAWLLKEHAATVGVEDAEGEASPGPEKMKTQRRSLEILSELNAVLPH